MRFSKIENEPKATPSPDSWGKAFIGSLLLLTKFSVAIILRFAHKRVIEFYLVRIVSFRGMHPRAPAVRQKDFAHCDGRLKALP